MSLDVEKCRSAFPSLKTGYIFADNAGGSQCLKDVADRVYDYLINTNVQLGADYSASVTATNRVAEGEKSTALLINCSPDEVVFGSSTTMLTENLSRAMDADILDGEELIITGEHEANVGPWKKLAKRRQFVKTVNWAHTPLPNAPSDNPYAIGLQIKDLLPLINSKTRIVAFTATSNLLGSVVDVEKVVKAIREEAKSKGARKVEICVDCVAYAPHRRMDVKKWDVDYAVFSYYKVYGPHCAAMYARKNSLANSLTELTHHFLKTAGKPYMLQPGGPGYEAVWSTTGVVPYLLSIVPELKDGDTNAALNEAFKKIEKHEHTLIEPLLSYLRSNRSRGIKILGDEEDSPSRVPTICFFVHGDKPISSKAVVQHFDKKGGIGIRYGHFYAYDLAASLSPPLSNVDEGAVRISLVHYNTVEEVQKLIAGLKEILD